VLSVLFREPSDSGRSAQSNYFVVIKNYFSPRNPDGAVGKLASYQLVSGVQLSSGDPIIDSTSATLSLSVARPAA
jgi:hypothetical protein